MRFITVLTSLFLGTVLASSAQAQSKGLCTDPLRQPEVCLRMQNMRATVNLLDAQRELMQVNYPYFASISGALVENVENIIQKIKMNRPEHVDGLKGVEKYAQEMGAFAQNQDPQTLVAANLVRTQCMNCHSATAPASGINWDEVFKHDWDSTVKRCNLPGRNPYVCKSMNGMLTAYGYILTSYNAGIQDFAMTEKTASEIVRILTDLKNNNLLHFAEAYRNDAELEAREIVKAAQAKDPDVFGRAVYLPQLCMKCHDNNGVHLPKLMQPSKAKLWFRQNLVK